jgi:hypothetical protein
VLGAVVAAAAADDSTGKSVMRLLLVALVALLLLQPARAQTRFTYSKGQSVAPSYEGWTPNDDGSFTLYFGYMNGNWLEEFDVPIGPNNTIEPAGPDQGQPTHFYPRRNPFLFTIRVPKDFGEKELVWTLTTNGVTERAYASLKTDYEINKQVISLEVGGDLGSTRDELRDNMPPDLEVQGAKQRSVTVGEPLILLAIAGDPDNLPPRRDGKPQPGLRVKPSGKPYKPNTRAQVGDPSSAETIFRPPVTQSPQSGPGLRLSWFVYRGKAAAVTFTPEQLKTWTDSRAYANSPWSPPYIIPEPPRDGKWETQATFQEPGTYVLRAVASDGSLFTYESVTVTVTR